jgi:hypothetical protein
VDAVVETEITRAASPVRWWPSADARRGFIRGYARRGPPTTRPFPCSDTIFESLPLHAGGHRARRAVLSGKGEKIRLDDRSRHLRSLRRGGSRMCGSGLSGTRLGLPPYLDPPRCPGHGPVCPDALLHAICDLQPLSPPGESSGTVASIHYDGSDVEVRRHAP